LYCSALATEEQVRAYGGPQFQLTQQVLQRFAEAIQAAGGGHCAPHPHQGQCRRHTSTGSVIEALMAMLLSDKLVLPCLIKGNDP